MVLVRPLSACAALGKGALHGADEFELAALQRRALHGAGSA